MPVAALSCPKCQRERMEAATTGDGPAFCRFCNVTFERMVFPALTAPRQAVRPQAVVAEDAVCFFHAENQAEAVCGGCGRYLCAVCAIDSQGDKLCPGCFAARRAPESSPERERVLYDSQAVALAFWPWFSLIFYILTPITAPWAIVVAIRGWGKPLGFGRSSRWRFVVAIIAAGLQILGVLAFLGTVLMAMLSR